MVENLVDKLLNDAYLGTSIFKNRLVVQIDHTPDQILHRDEELSTVTQTLLPITKQSRPSNLLIYGKPGTGKTLVTRYVLEKIQKNLEKKQLDYNIKIVFLNAKNESTLYGLLVHLGNELDPDNELPKTGLSISSLFDKIIDTIKSKSFKVVFVIDEIDFLVKLIQKTGNDILYNLTRANERLGGKDPNEKGSLTLIGISNNLTFKENLDPRVISSLGEEEIIFTNYSVEHLHKILEERIKLAFIKNSVEESALNLCAAMAGREHGDARRAIDLIRVAGDIAERQQSNKITIEHIKAASQKIEESKEKSALKSYPLHEKLLIVGVMKANGSSTGEIYSSYRNICKTVRQKELTQRRITQMLSEIELSGIITGRLVHQGIHGRTKKYKLTISSETIKDTFKDDLTLEDIV